MLLPAEVRARIRDEAKAETAQTKDVQGVRV
jgi:hypothetical protein